MLRTRLRFVVLVTLLTLPASIQAAPITIDFEGLEDLSDVGLQIPGLTITNAMVLSAEISLNEEELPPASGSNVVFDSGGPLTIAFEDLVASVGGSFNYYLPVTLEAFDSLGNSLGSTTTQFLSNAVGFGDEGSLQNEFIGLALSSPRIASVTLTGGPDGGSFTLDDLTYDNAGPTTVPEPGSLSLFFVGYAALWAKRLYGSKRAVDN
jgi:hypothetical protein